MASNYLLVIEGISGESQSKAKPKSIELDSFGWGATNPTNFSSGGGGGKGKVSFQDFHFTKKLDSSSPTLAEFCFHGSSFKATLHVHKQGDKNAPVEYFTVKLTEAGISNYSASGSGDQGDVFEQFSIGFAQVEIEYTEQTDKNTKGSKVRSGWNVKQDGPV